MSDSKNVISQEIAEEQIELLFDYYDIDLDDYKGVLLNGADASKGLAVSKKKLVKAVRRGRLTVETNEENGQLRIIQKLVGKYSHGDTLEYKPISGRAKVAMEQFDGQDSKTYALLGSLTGKDAAVIQALRGPDLSIAESLGGFFLLG